MHSHQSSISGFPISFCKPSFFYNVSQQYRSQFLVYDLKLGPSILKNSFQLQFEECKERKLTISSTSEIINHIVQIENNQEKLHMQKLFANRKRNFNFFFPFLRKDNFSEFVKQRLENHQSYQKFKDSYQLPLEEVQKFIHEFSELEKANSLNSNDDLNLNQNLQCFHLMLELIQLFKKEKFLEIIIFYQTAEQIFSEYSYLDYSISRNKIFLDKNLPNEIIERKLFLGNAQHSSDPELIQGLLSITHIINAAKEVINQCDKVQYLNIEICDEVTEKILCHFDEVYDFINNQWENNNSRVLVHCAQGRSRSAALVVMFVMRRFGWTLNQSYIYVKSRRDIIKINDGFWQQLEKYEQKLNFQKQ